MHHQPQNQERTSICQSSLCPDLVSFPVLSRIKPQIPHLVVPFRQFLQVSALQPYSPQNPSTQWFPSKIQKESFFFSYLFFLLFLLLLLSFFFQINKEKQKQPAKSIDLYFSFYLSSLVGIVYGIGLRRYLIIFDPQAFVLD